MHTLKKNEQRDIIKDFWVKSPFKVCDLLLPQTHSCQQDICASQLV